MNQIVVYTRGSRGGRGGDLIYQEGAGSARHLSVLLQDRAPGPSPSRRHFLNHSFRFIVARFNETQRIQVPAEFFRGLVREMDTISRRLDCRVDDFTDLGVYVLFRDGATLWVLSGRSGEIRVRRCGAFVRLDADAFTREVTVETPRNQRELFTQTMRDFLILCRVDLPSDRELELIVGGSPQDRGVVEDDLLRGGLSEMSAGRREVPAIGHDVLLARFAPVAARRVSMSPDGSGPHRRNRRIAIGSGITIVVSLLSVAIAQREPAPDALRIPGVRALAPHEKGPRVRERATEAAEHRARSGVVADSSQGVTTRLSLEWSAVIGEPVTSTPVIVGDLVVFGARDGYLYAYQRATGEREWVYRAGAGIGSSPVYAERLIIAADYSGKVFAVDAASGKERWAQKMPAKVVSTGAITAGRVLVGCMDGSAWCLSVETGRVLWKYRTGDRIRASAVASRNQFFISSFDGSVYALAAETGRQLWRAPAGGAAESSPAWSDNRLYTGTADGRVVALETGRGEVVWSRKVDSAVKSFVRVERGHVYVGTADGRLLSLNAETGEIAWSFRTRGAVFARVWIDGDLVFVASYDQYVYMLDRKDGSEIARFATGGEVYSSPAGDGERIFVGNNSGRFFALRYTTGRAL